MTALQPEKYRAGAGPEEASPPHSVWGIIAALCDGVNGGFLLPEEGAGDIWEQTSTCLLLMPMVREREESWASLELAV